MKNEHESMLGERNIGDDRTLGFGLWTVFSACTCFAIALAISIDYGRGLLAPVTLTLFSVERFAFAGDIQGRSGWVTLGIIVGCYAIFIPGLDGYVDHLFWHVFRAARFSNNTLLYGLLQYLALLMPVAVHGCLATMVGMLAVRKPAFLIVAASVGLICTTACSAFLTGSVWVDPIFELESLTWPAGWLLFLLLSSAVVLLLVRSLGRSQDEDDKDRSYPFAAMQVGFVALFIALLVWYL